MNNPLRALRGTLFVSLCDPRRRMRDDHHEPVPHPERCRDGDRDCRARDRVCDGDATAAGGGACAPDDLALTGGAWGAAAGSRGAEVSVENRGSAACTLARRPVGRAPRRRGNGHHREPSRRPTSPGRRSNRVA